jgi:hypothetical protein
MGSDDRLIGEIHQSGRVIANDMAHDAIFLRQRNGFDPCGIVSRRILLENLLAVNAVGIPFHHDGSSAQMR